MNDGCGAGELSPGQSWTWDELSTSGHLLIQSLTTQGVGALLGAALDGDGDRCLLVRETNDGVEVVDGDDIADAVLRACPKAWKVAASIESNLKLLSNIEEDANMQGFETAVGDRWLSHALAPHVPVQEQQPLLFGIEDSGHIVLPSPHPSDTQSMESRRRWSHDLASCFACLRIGRDRIHAKRMEEATERQESKPLDVGRSKRTCRYGRGNGSNPFGTRW